MNHQASCSIEGSYAHSASDGFKARILRQATKASESPLSFAILFLIGVVEACICPMPIDEAIISLGVIKPRNALWYSLVAICGAVSGGFIGYAIGHAAYQSFGSSLINWFGWERAAGEVLTAYRNEGIKTLTTSGFIPLPYVLFTILAGANKTVPLHQFAVAATAGRVIRILPLGIIFRLWGQRLSPLISKHIDKVIFITGGAMIFISVLRLLFDL